MGLCALTTIDGGDDLRRVSASVVVYDGYEEARLAAGTLLEYTRGVELDLYLVDNHSPDGSGEKLQQEFGGRATVICLPENKGFGAGHNVVRDRLDSRYHAVINPDITVNSDVLTAMADYLDSHPDAAAVTPRLLFPDGREQEIAKRNPTLLALMGRRLPFAFLRKAEDDYLMRDQDLSVPCSIEFCTGCFFMMRTEIFQKIGGFDERYFMYFEDADIGRMAAQYGNIVHLPQVTVYHAWHRQTAKRADHFLWQLRSMFRYFHKWGFRLK